MPVPRFRNSMLVGLVAVLALWAPSAHAESFDVDSPADAHDSDTGDGICAALVSDALVCTLRAAIEQANALAGEDIVSVPGGTYQLTISGGGALEITDDLTIDGFSSPVVRQENPGTAEGDRVFDIAPPDGGQAPIVVLAGLTIEGGQAHATNGFFGGNVRSSGTLTIRNSTIRGGTGDSAGGIANVAGKLLVDSSTISGNVAPTSPGAGGDAGAILNFGGGADVPATLDIRNSTISGNNARLAGAIFSYNSPANAVTVDSSTITDNHSGDRGGGGGLTVASGSATV